MEYPRPASGARRPLASRIVGYVCIPADGRLELETASRAMAQWCEGHGLTLSKIIHDLEPFSGRTSDRPGLVHGLGEIAEGAAGGIVVSRMRDISGAVSDLGPILRWLDDASARVIVLDFDIDNSTVAGGLALEALIEVSAWERDRLAARTRPGLAALEAERGAKRSRAVRDDPQLNSRIRTLRESGMSLQAIADALNADGVPTLRGGKQWRPSSVQGAAGYKRPASDSSRLVLPQLPWRPQNTRT